MAAGRPRRARRAQRLLRRIRRPDPRRPDRGGVLERGGLSGGLDGPPRGGLSLLVGRRPLVFRNRNRVSTESAEAPGSRGTTSAAYPCGTQARSNEASRDASALECNLI